MIGSEGTLGFLTKLTVKLVPEPKANLSLLIPFADLEACIEAVAEVLRCGCDPTAVEFMEREVISNAEMYLGKQFPDTSADAYLLVRLDGASMEALRPSIDTLTGSGPESRRIGCAAGRYRRTEGKHLECPRSIFGGNQKRHTQHGRMRCSCSEG